MGGKAASMARLQAVPNKVKPAKDGSGKYPYGFVRRELASMFLGAKVRQFTMAELSEPFDISVNSIGYHLRSLMKEGLVKRKGHRYCYDSTYKTPEEIRTIALTLGKERVKQSEVGFQLGVPSITVVEGPRYRLMMFDSILARMEGLPFTEFDRVFMTEIRSLLEVGSKTGK